MALNKPLITAVSDTSFLCLSPPPIYPPAHSGSHCSHGAGRNQKRSSPFPHLAKKKPTQGRLKPGPNAQLAAEPLLGAATHCTCPRFYLVPQLPPNHCSHRKARWPIPTPSHAASVLRWTNPLPDPLSLLSFPLLSTSPPPSGHPQRLTLLGDPPRECGAGLCPPGSSSLPPA